MFCALISSRKHDEFCNPIQSHNQYGAECRPSNNNDTVQNPTLNVFSIRLSCSDWQNQDNQRRKTKCGKYAMIAKLNPNVGNVPTNLCLPYLPHHRETPTTRSLTVNLRKSTTTCITYNKRESPPK